MPAASRSGVHTTSLGRFSTRSWCALESATGPVRTEVVVAELAFGPGDPLSEAKSDPGASSRDEFIQDLVIRAASGDVTLGDLVAQS